MKIGFIGLGNMAKAMIGGMLSKEIVRKEDIIGSAKTEHTLDQVNQNRSALGHYLREAEA